MRKEPVKINVKIYKSDNDECIINELYKFENAITMLTSGRLAIPRLNRTEGFIIYKIKESYYHITNDILCLHVDEEITVK
ncbi:hypothetical protein [Clostridium cibarium]|uniref:Uncharacterized protein n=1 Tax=Clostridium cibarium TaxID=2762247 RepID=A0ABR8PNT2_9CLOT|nr:hypothetical protein [Clostridium cibarium]MBD7909729.1 hypothetical protein [Clostridium cibarium]